MYLHISCNMCNKITKILHISFSTIFTTSLILNFFSLTDTCKIPDRNVLKFTYVECYARCLRKQIRLFVNIHLVNKNN